jgi:hypothetical protein
VICQIQETWPQNSGRRRDGDTMTLEAEATGDARAIRLVPERAHFG